MSQTLKILILSLLLAACADQQPSKTDWLAQAPELAPDNTTDSSTLSDVGGSHAHSGHH